MELALAPSVAAEPAEQLGSDPDRGRVDRADQAGYTAADSGSAASGLAVDILELDMDCSPSAEAHSLDIAPLVADLAADRDIARTEDPDVDKVDFVERRGWDGGKGLEADTVLADWVAEGRTLALDSLAGRRVEDLEEADSLEETKFSSRAERESETV